MNNVVKTTEYRGHTIETHRDDNPENPRDGFSNLGVMVCWHRRYKLGDKHGFKTPGDFQRWLEPKWVMAKDDDNGDPQYLFVGDVRTDWASHLVNATEFLALERVKFPLLDNAHWERVDDTGDGDGSEVMMLWLYDHSGITMSTGSFDHIDSDRWDSGPVGYYYVTREKIIEEYGDDSKESREKARKCMQQEVELYDNYLTGEVYGYVIEDYMINESCWGYYGDDGLRFDGVEAYMITDAKGVIDSAIKHEAEQRAKIHEMMAL